MKITFKCEYILFATLAVAFAHLFQAPAVARQSREEKYREWREKRRQYEANRQKQFADYLEERWRKMKEFRSSSVYSAPKFKTPPVSQSSVSSQPRRLESYEKVSAETGAVFKPESTGESGSGREAGAEQITPGQTDTWLTYDWYGAVVAVPELEPLPGAAGSESDLKAVAAGFSRAYEKADRAGLVNFLKKYRKKLDLRGWHELYFVFSGVRAVLEKQAGSASRVNALLATWAIARDLNYDVRLGLSGGKFYLLYRPGRVLPGTSYYTLAGRDYYLFLPGELGTPSESLSTYGKSQSEELKPVRPYPTRLPELPWEPARRQLEFKYRGRSEKFELEFNKNLSRYYRSVPQVEPVHYFKRIDPSGIDSGFLAAVRRRISGFETEKALDYLLRLTQRGFDYKTDDEHLGRQWYMIPAETTKRPFSDCDDRSIFYAWLVRNLLDLEVVGVKWPGHLSTAVEFPAPEKIKGHYVSLTGKTYVLADPTYIGAGPGQVMEELKDESPQFLFPF